VKIRDIEGQVHIITDGIFRVYKDHAKGKWILAYQGPLGGMVLFAHKERRSVNEALHKVWVSDKADFKETRNA